MINSIKKYPFALLFVMACTWQLFLIIALQLDQQHLIFPDSLNYLRASKILYYTQESHHHRPIGLSLLVGIPWLFKVSESFIYGWSWVLNLLSWLGTIFILFEILKKISRPTIAFWIATIYLFCVGPAILTMHLLSETYYVFMIMLALLLLQRYKENVRARYLFLAISIVVVSWLFRPISKFLVVFMMLVYSKDILTHIKNKYTVLMVLSFIFVLLQCGMNYHKFGNFKVSYIDSFTMYNYINSQAEAKRLQVERKRFSEARYQDFMKLSLPEREVLGKSDFKNHITGNTQNVMTSWIGNVYENATVPSLTFEYLKNIKQSDSFTTIRDGLSQLSVVQNIVFSVLGLILIIVLGFKIIFSKSFKIRNHKFEIFLGFMITYLVAASGISFGQGDRFHLVVFPFILILMFQMGLFRKFNVR